jgi:enoyl-CoA hydratase/carnithine racemase
LSSNSPGSPEGGPGRLILEEPAPGVARLVISNPAKRGALDHTILDAFARTLPQLDARCLIITGEGTTFSSGYDIGALDGPGSRMFADEAEKLVAHPYTAALDAIESYPFPTVAALNGHAIGGGLEIALSCDLRIAAGTIALGMPPARLGLVYSHTGIRKFIDTIGAPRTRELFLTARRIDARTARSWGLINQLSEPGRLADDALKLAVEIAGHAPLAQAGNKRVIGAVLAAQGRIDPAVERELVELRRACFESEDFREAVQAFAQKRPPEWRGR